MYVLVVLGMNLDRHGRHQNFGINSRLIVFEIVQCVAYKIFV